MSEELYSVEQVAERLGLHVKTVRNYVREGRLKAVRIGKQYRIARQDLEAMTGRPEPAPEPISRTRHVEVSSIVEIDAISPESANRLTGAMMATAEGVRVEAIYNRERGHLKIILVGSMERNAAYFNLIAAILESEK
jgi:excisionase family DNA binding protein